jgi:hypothetical protein
MATDVALIVGISGFLITHAILKAVERFSPTFWAHKRAMLLSEADVRGCTTSIYGTRPDESTGTEISPKNVSLPLPTL